MGNFLTTFFPLLYPLLLSLSTRPDKISQQSLSYTRECTAIAGTAGTTQCNSKCTPDYCIPADWNTQYVNTLTPGVEPLNVIISARSTVPLDDILVALNGWSAVLTGSPPRGCLSPEEANVTGSKVIQLKSWRLEGCRRGFKLSLTGEENHARLWNQPIPGSMFGAWFISASYETACVDTTAGLEPLNDLHDWPTSGPWHCIDGGQGSYDSNGYDHGATSLATDLVQAAHKKGWYAVMRTDTRSAGTGEDGVRFGSAVYVLTVDYGASGYRYEVVPTGADQGFQAPTYHDSAFSDGTAAFGLALNGCSLDSTIKTNWPSNTGSLFVRCQFMEKIAGHRNQLGMLA